MMTTPAAIRIAQSIARKKARGLVERRAWVPPTLLEQLESLFPSPNGGVDWVAASQAAVVASAAGYGGLSPAELYELKTRHPERYSRVIKARANADAAFIRSA